MSSSSRIALRRNGIPIFLPSCAHLSPSLSLPPFIVYSMSSVRPTDSSSSELCLLASISKDDGREHLRLRLRCGRFDGYRQTTLPRTLCANFRLLKERYENTINALLIFPSTLALCSFFLPFHFFPFLFSSESLISHGTQTAGKTSLFRCCFPHPF